MPNIIEQQDLLKNLPDARLATLLQNPVADIPPFLVAAEAQRRQSIRQQFAGSESKESVVDTLAKQISKVPQNIQTPAQKPPMIPPTPQMQGVAALQQQQAVQNIAQQAQQQPQQMRHGGVVQRYQAAGMVMPLSNRVQAIADQFGVTVQEAAEMLKNNPSIGSKAVEPDFDFSLPDVPVGEARKDEDFSLPDVPVGKARRAANVEPLNSEPPPPPEPGETKDEYRARVEALFASQEPSNWEKAQKWFAMAEQFLDPSKTTMQSIAGAGQAFAQSAAEQARAKRELELAGKKAMLEYDISERDRLAAQKTAGREEQIATQKFYAEQAQGQIKAIATLIDDTARKKADYIKATYPPDFEGNVNINPNDPVLQNFDAAIQKYSTMIDAYVGQQSGALRGLGKLTGTSPSIPTFTGEGLAYP